DALGGPLNPAAFADSLQRSSFSLKAKGTVDHELENAKLSATVRPSLPARATRTTGSRSMTRLRRARAATVTCGSASKTYLAAGKDHGAFCTLPPQQPEERQPQTMPSKAPTTIKVRSCLRILLPFTDSRSA